VKIWVYSTYIQKIIVSIFLTMKATILDTHGCVMEALACDISLWTLNLYRVIVDARHWHLITMFVYFSFVRILDSGISKGFHVPLPPHTHKKGRRIEAFFDILNLIHTTLYVLSHIFSYFLILSHTFFILFSYFFHTFSYFLILAHTFSYISHTFSYFLTHILPIKTMPLFRSWLCLISCFPWVNKEFSSRVWPLRNNNWKMSSKFSFCCRNLISWIERQTLSLGLQILQILNTEILFQKCDFRN